MNRRAGGPVLCAPKDTRYEPVTSELLVLQGDLTPRRMAGGASSGVFVASSRLKRAARAGLSWLLQLK